MTVCMYASPRWNEEDQGSILPVVIADIMATLEEAPQNAVRSLPTTLTTESASRPNTVVLRRKLWTWDRVAFAMAGFSRCIDAAVHEILRVLPELETMERPVGWVGDMANRACTAAQRGDALNVIGAYCRPDGGTYTTGMECVEIKWFGVCRAVGSGAQDLVERCQKFRDWAPPEESTATDRALGMINALNARLLAHEILGRQVTWGGYLEWAYWDNHAAIWRRGMDMLHAFYGMAPTGQGTYTVFPLNRHIAYRSDSLRGRLLGMTADANGVLFAEAQFRDEVSYGPEDNRITWEDWSPGCATATIIFSDPPDKADAALTTKTFGKNDVVWKITPNGFHLGIEKPAFNDFCASALAEYGLTHEPVP